MQLVGCTNIQAVTQAAYSWICENRLKHFAIGHFGYYRSLSTLHKIQIL